MGDTARFNSPDNHYHYPQKQGLGEIAKTAIAAGLLGTGIGAGIGGPMLIDALTGETKPPVVQPGTNEIRDWELLPPIVE